MGARAAVFDEWVKKSQNCMQEAFPESCIDCLNIENCKLQFAGGC